MKVLTILLTNIILAILYIRLMNIIRFLLLMIKERIILNDLNIF